ncbi:hypothetical protein [Streptomyces cinereoruber]|uniref:hypothetical protein n=1 Tax=Streptomyces cinereoruber TaxID=67260 RepID=UPI003639F7C5
MPELVGPDDTETAAKNKFTLKLGPVHLRMENVSERVQLAVIYGATALGLGAVAVYAAHLMASQPAAEEEDAEAT